MMFLLTIFIVNILGIGTTSIEVPLNNNHDVQSNPVNLVLMHRYRRDAVHTKITDDHIQIILKKLGSPDTDFSTQLSASSYPRDITYTIEMTKPSVKPQTSAYYSSDATTLSNTTFDIPSFQTKRLPVNPDVIAPDGSLVRTLLSTLGGSMAQFELPPAMTSNAVQHRTVYEIWYFLSGEGEFWRKQNQREEIVKVDAEICITIPVGTQFQFRTIGRKPLVAVAITMPPWPGQDEAIPIPGIWNASFTGIRNSCSNTRQSRMIFVACVAVLLRYVY